jgi:hypothetical protein
VESSLRENQFALQPKMSLRFPLTNATVTCSLTNNKYIPWGVIRETVTPDAVAERLPASWRQWLFQPFRGGAARDNIQRARKVIAVLVLISRYDAIESLLADGIVDEDLPLSKEGDRIVSQSGKIFKAFQTCEKPQDFTEMFFENQSSVLAPVLEFIPGHVIDIRLHPSCALPFTCKLIESTNFSEVYDAVLQPSHDKGWEFNVSFITVLCSFCLTRLTRV